MRIHVTRSKALLYKAAVLIHEASYFIKNETALISHKLSDIEVKGSQKEQVCSEETVYLSKLFAFSIHFFYIPA